MKKRIVCILLALALVLGAFGGVTVRAAERNLALNRPATASSVANDCGPELAVDGVTAGPQWNSENMKNGTVADDAPRTSSGSRWIWVPPAPPSARSSCGTT